MSTETTATISFLLWPAPGSCPTRRNLHFLGWSRDRHALLLYSEHGDRCALRLHLHQYSVFGFHYHPDAIPGHDPLSISLTALHRPPCRANREQADAIKTFWWDKQPDTVLPELWEGGWNALFLDETDDPELARRLKAYQRNHRGTASVSLEDVKAGALGIRDDYLIEHWAQRFGFDLKVIARDAILFRVWMKEAAFNVKATNAGGASLQLSDARWQFLEMATQYELRYQDGTRIWLAGVDESQALTPQEVEDFEKLEASADLEGRRLATRQECCKAWGVGDRRMRQICATEGIEVARITVRDMERIRKKLLRRKRYRAEKVAAQNIKRKADRRR